MNNTEINSKPLQDRTVDDVMFEYLKKFKANTNNEYFTLMVKFIILFRESFNISAKKNDNSLMTEYSTIVNAENVPDSCNEFYTDFLEMNDFFGMNSDKEKIEIIDLIQHFCIWLYKSFYTKSKLSLASN